MRTLLLLHLLIALTAAAAPPAAGGRVVDELREALARFRPEPPRGWSFTQTTVAEGRSTAERCDAAKPEFDRWSLVQKGGRQPTVDERREYAEGRSRRSRGGTAPKLVEQLDLASLEVIAESAERATFRCAVKPGDANDNVARFLRATIVLHRPSRHIASFALGSSTAFNPTFGVKITEMNTVMTYHPPAGDRPSLPHAVTTRVRGRAFLVKSLDAEMTVTFSDYEWAGRK